jgi:SAM-dependent methyltransferase
MPPFDPRDVRSLEDAFSSALAGAGGAAERRALLSRLLSSPEFHRIRETWRDAPQTVPPPGDHALGPDAGFVRIAYECLLGRPADENGLRHYLTALAEGGTRANVLRALALSEEFERRSHGLLEDVQLCELANPAKWDNGEWLDILRGLGLADDKLSMHRKPYEFTQLIYGCRKLGALREDASIVSVGAGHELVLYWLANHAARVMAIDMYDGVWQDVQGREGNPDVLRRPEEYAPFPYRRDRLTFMRMDGRQLAFADRTFDIAYSLSSIEHFGGMEGSAAAFREMARVLKPGGILALPTEYVLQGPPHAETFQPREFAELIDQPGLRLVQPIDDSVYRRYSFRVVDLHKNPYQTPHMVVRFSDTVFTTVMVFLRKLPDGSGRFSRPSDGSRTSP